MVTVLALDGYDLVVLSLFFKIAHRSPKYNVVYERRCERKERSDKGKLNVAFQQPDYD